MLHSVKVVVMDEAGHVSFELSVGEWISRDDAHKIAAHIFNKHVSECHLGDCGHGS